MILFESKALAGGKYKHNGLGNSLSLKGKKKSRSVDVIIAIRVTVCCSTDQLNCRFSTVNNMDKLSFYLYIHRYVIVTVIGI